MTTSPPLVYDLATLKQARHDSPLQVQNGLAVTRQWVARADAATRCDELLAGGPAADAYFQASPALRATMSLVLEDAQQYVDQHPDLWASAFVVNHADSTEQCVCLHQPSTGVAIRLLRAHSALIEDGDWLAAVQRHPQIYVLVLRGRTVKAAIKALVDPEARQQELVSQLPHVRRHFRQRRRR